MVSEDIGEYNPDEDEEVPGEVTRAQRQKAETTKAKVAQAAAALEKQKIEPMEGSEDYRVFVAPVEKNTEFLAKVGKMIQFPDKDSPSGTRDSRREGDVWVRFTNGILCTNDPIQVAWCEKNPEVCRDANDPRTKAWAILKEGQTATASREATTDPRLDIDELIDSAGAAAEAAARASRSTLMDTAEGQLKDAL